MGDGGGPGIGLEILAALIAAAVSVSPYWGGDTGAVIAAMLYAPATGCGYEHGPA